MLDTARRVLGYEMRIAEWIGLAVLLTVFSAKRRSTLTGAFLAGASVGSVLGVMIGGAVADAFGWRAAFIAFGLAGIVLTAFYALAITDKRLARNADPEQERMSAAESDDVRGRFITLVSTPSVIAAYLASGLQLLVVGALYAWLPSFFVRDYEVSTTAAGAFAGLVVLVVAIGMVLNGAITDRISEKVPIRTWEASIAFCLLSMVFLLVGFRLPNGPAQVGVLCLGAFFCAAITGPAGAMVANLTPSSIRATAFATLSMANNLLGLAAGPMVVGALADRMGLGPALGLAPLIVREVLLVVARLRTLARTAAEEQG